MIYKALLLDFGGVVFRNKEDYEGPKGLLDIDQSLWQQGTLGTVDDNYIFEQVGVTYGVDAATIQQWLVSRREVNFEVTQMLSLLRPDIKTAVVNNGLKTLFRSLLDTYHVTEKFDLVINSAEEGVKKPEPELYLITCRRLGVQPEECVFVDDNDSFIQGATNLGMYGIKFTSVTELRNELEKLDLLKV